jgi:hypothetical protein
MDNPPVPVPTSAGDARPVARRFRLPLPLMIVTIVISIAVEEFYPLSWFPMFTALGKNTYYVFLTDDAGAKVPIAEEFGWTADRTDNFFKHRLARVRRDQPQLAPAESLRVAAESTLVQLLVGRTFEARGIAGDPAYRLWRTDIRLKDGSLSQKDTELARMARSDAVRIDSLAPAARSQPSAADDGERDDEEDDG